MTEENKKNDIHTAVGLIIILIEVAIFGAIFYAVTTQIKVELSFAIFPMKKNANLNVNKVTNANTNTVADETAGWKTYESEAYGFSFKYPADWKLLEPSQAETANGVIVSLRSPATEELLKEGKINAGYSYDLVVSFWSNINNQSARGGSWEGQRNYTDLADYFTDKNAAKQKIGEITIDGQTAYEVSIGGAGLNYGVMIEHNGVYQLSFETAWDKSKLSSIGKQIFSTFQFTD